MTRTNLLLISPSALYDARLWGPILPCKPHLYSLAGFVRDVADVRIVDLDVAMAPPRSFDAIDVWIERIGDHLDLSGVDLVGISCWTSFHYLATVAVARVVRAQCPNVPIVVGGHHATAVPSDFADETGLFDFVVRGDGEHALYALCEERPGRPPHPRVVDGQALELAGLSAFAWADYPWHDEEQRVLWLNLSRGCPFECEFCIGRARRTAYAVEDALALLEQLALYRAPRRILFADPLFGVDRAWTCALLDGIEERGLSMKFWAETRADLLSEELLDRFRAAGFCLDFGLDTGSATMVRHQRKSRSPDGYLSHARRILEHADAIELPHLMYLLFNFPGETPETMRETMRFVESLDKDAQSLSGMPAGGTFYLLPGTGAYRRMDEHAATLGTEIRHPTWWKEVGDQHKLATDNLPSASFKGREDERHAWAAWQHEINVRWWPRRPRHVQQLYREMFG